MDKSKSESVVENEFRKLRMIDPLNYRLYINLGDYYKKNLGTDESRQSTIIAKDKEIISKMESAYQTALKLNEYAEEVYGKLSNIFNKLGDTNKADEILKKGLEKFPINVSMLSELGKSYETKGKYEEALKYYLRIKELEPKNINSYLNLARTYNKLGDKKNETDMYYKILQIDSKNKFALNALTQY
jgi:tetratricopeptide (TPR) repeat protein